MHLTSWWSSVVGFVGRGELFGKGSAVCALVILLCIGVVAQDKPSFIASAEDKMYRDLNAERKKRSLEPLRREPRLDESAQAHGARMYESGVLTHQLNKEPSVRLRIAATGLHFNYSGENLAYSTELEDLLPNLMQSPGHRANILDEKFNAIGIAIFKRGNRYYAVQNFARVTSEASVATAEQEFIDAFNLFRKGHNLSPVTFATEQRIRTAACGMALDDELSAKGMPMGGSFRRATAFTTFEPSELPDNVKKVASDSNLRQAQIGACQKATRTYASGVYWFGMVY